MMRNILACLVVFLSACGGGDDIVEPVVVLDGSTVKALSAAPPAQDFAAQKLMMAILLSGRDCLTLAEYDQMIKDRRFLPIPTEVPEGSLWDSPFLLVPAVEPPPRTPGSFAGTPVVVAGPNGPMNIKGLYYVEGETPDWVCKP